MSTLDDILSEGLEHHRAGRFEPAEKLYLHVLSTDPDNSEALQQYQETQELVEQYQNQKSSKRSDEARPKSAPPQLEMEITAAAEPNPAEPNPAPEETTSGFWRMMGY